MDRLTPEHRSWNMSRIAGRNTVPEQALRRILHRIGFRFRLTTGEKVFGKPDIVLPKYRTVVFMHGCFWHRHRNCKQCYTPKTRIDFWKRKFESNKKHDRRVGRALHREGWHVVIVWECQLRNIRALEKRFTRVKSRYGNGTSRRTVSGKRTHAE